MEDSKYFEMVDEYKKNKESYDSLLKEKEAISIKIGLLRKNMEGLIQSVGQIVIKKVPDMETILRKENELDERLKEQEEKEKEYLDSISSMKTHIKILKKQMSSIDGKSTCPTCGQSIEECLHIDNIKSLKTLEKSLSVTSGQYEEEVKPKILDIKESNRKLNKIKLLSENVKNDLKQKSRMEEEIRLIEKELAKLSENESNLVKMSSNDLKSVLLSKEKIDMEEEYRDKIKELKRYIKSFGKRVDLEEYT
jgi:DNA repair exonuclease SbcCD ATPase subunit